MSRRAFRDSTGNNWSVWEVLPTNGSDEADDALPRQANLHPELASGWLCFASQYDRRRLAPVPDHWMELSGERLEDLLKVARRVPSMSSGAPSETEFLPTTSFLSTLEWARAAGRTVNTPDGPIMVYELEPGDLNPGPTTLVFEGTDRYWRLPSYPEDWRTLEDEELLGLRDRRKRKTD